MGNLKEHPKSTSSPVYMYVLSTAERDGDIHNERLQNLNATQEQRQYKRLHDHINIVLSIRIKALLIDVVNMRRHRSTCTCNCVFVVSKNQKLQQ